MPKREWSDGVLGNTPLSAARLNQLEADLEAALLALSRDPEALFAGAVTRDADGAATSAVVLWPDGTDGNYAGTASVEFPGSVDAYTMTYIGADATRTYTQPAVTRDTAGYVTNRPPITVS